MAEIATLNQQVQIGVETVAGTTPAGGADKLLTGINFKIDPSFDATTYRAAYRRFPSVKVPGMESSKLAYDGVPTYTELEYIFSGLWGAPTITTPTGATLARKAAWNVPLTGAANGKTLVLQKGDPALAGKARQVNYGTLTDIALDLTRKEAKLSGSGFAQQVQTGITLTSSPTALAEIPIAPKHWSLYCDTSSSGIGGTQLSRCFSAKFAYGGSYNDVWPLNRSNASFAATVDQAPKATLELSVMADDEADTLFTAARAGQKLYVRMEAIGDQIEAGTPNQYYSLVMDMVLGLSPDAYADDSGAWTQSMKFDILSDDAWTEGSASGTGLYVYLINKIVSL